ncbi:sensor histidine kinase [Nonomuraea sp. NPDC049714]|uniref:sensor histidine kinase n=1 Tax=Nonomuraea sp. NPDC049714 TaxID=3364357 RepID=UPI00379A5D4A
MLSDHVRTPDGRPYDPLDAKGILVFVLLGVAAAWDAATGVDRPAWLAWLGLAGVAALYAAAVLLAFRRVPALATAALIALAAVVTALAAHFGGGWLYLFPLVGIACGVVLYGRRVRIALLALTGVTALVVWRGGGQLESIMTFSWGTFSAGIVVAFILHLHALIAELHDTRQQLAEAAVTRERLRFARDLHDLLGHTLSVIVVKAEAVRRLALRDPEQARRQAGDIETVGRQALTEVREAVTGYREASLTGELDRAVDALRAAGVEPVVRRTGPEPDGRAQTLLGWVVREGVTNIIRHSGATRAEIELTGTSLTIRDNGPTPPPTGTASKPTAAVTPAGTTTTTSTTTSTTTTSDTAEDAAAAEVAFGGASGGGGSGLRGLAERLAQAGGQVEAGPLPEGGWQLRVFLPQD